MEIHKVVSALPGTLEADSIYAVRVGDGFDLYVTDNTGSPQAKSLNLNSLIQEAIFDTGDLVFSYATAKTGWLLVDADLTIGNTGSGADHEGSDYSALFDLVKLAEPNLGSEVFASNDTVSIRLENCVLAARSSAAGRLTVAGSGINATTLGAVGGTETHSLTSSQNAAHSHATHLHQLVGYAAGSNRIGYLNHGSSSSVGGWSYVGNAGTGSSGSGSAHQNTQPTAILNLFIKL